MNNAGDFGSRPERHRGSDYTISNFTLIVMSDDGRPFRIIQATRMSHYPKDDSAEIINPIADVITSEKNTWVVTSNQGTTYEKGENILFSGNVIIAKKIMKSNYLPRS